MYIYIYIYIYLFILHAQVSGFGVPPSGHQRRRQAFPSSTNPAWCISSEISLRRCQSGKRNSNKLAKVQLMLMRQHGPSTGALCAESPPKYECNK